MVPMEGLEPPRLAALDPKSSVSANSTTWAIDQKPEGIRLEPRDQVPA